ncbi:hypothetical protein L596_017692 [Steinernema carpocapsae]|uniref:F-box associated domain-containing protein n=1 Tax=Steinernema carpocapsae TaxID=34508 RepID=A0A4U5N346_STECR|nr:hypothetical protein L596_017692 [Steinernema carpocapsae]
MNSVPTEFYEEVFTTSSQQRLANYAGPVSGKFGSVANRCWTKVYQKGILLIDGKNQDSVFFDSRGNRYTSEEGFCQKYRHLTNLCFTADDQIPPIDKKFVKKFLSEPGKHSLQLYSTIDNAWIEEFASWKKLAHVELKILCDDNVLKLLRKLLDLKQLTELYLEFSDQDSIDLACDFLKQDQFRFLSFREFSKEQLMAIWQIDSKQLSKKTIWWKGQVHLHGKHFTRVVRSFTDTIDYESSDRIVRYFNPDGTSEMNKEAFMAGVTKSIVTFL